MKPRDCPDCGADDRLHDEIEAALADSALEPDLRRQMADEARQRAASPSTRAPEWTVAMPKRRESLLSFALAASLLLIVAAALIFPPRGAEPPGERPDEVDVARVPGEEPLAPEAPTDDPLPERAPATIGVLAGQVRASDGRRLEGVTVDIMFDPWRSGKRKLPEGEKSRHSAETDGYGDFHFEGLPLGYWRLTVAAEGLAAREITGLELTDRAGVQGIAVVLLAEGAEVGTIEGTATGTADKPLARALITIRGTAGGSYHTTRTDEEGKYRADRLLPGSYSVSCQQYAGTSSTDFFLVAKQTRYVDVRPGKVTRADFAGSGTVTGVVLDEQGKPMPRMIVRVAPLDGKGNFRDGKYQPVEGSTDKAGRFRLGNAGVGLQSVTVQSTEAGNSFSVRLADVELDGGDREITLRLVDSGIAGRVTLAETEKPPEARVHVALYRIKPWAFMATAGVDAEGLYRFRSVSPGKYRLFVDLRDHRRAEVDVDLGAGERRAGLDFALEKLRPGTIVFTVEDADGKPVEGLRFSYNSRGDVWSTLHVDRGEPGVYTNRQLETGTWEIHVSRKDLVTKRVEVTVVSDETTKVRVVMEPRPEK